MREIVMDTETTGLDPATGDRLVEIGAVELMNHLPTGRTFHKYINPQRDVPEGAVAVHGLTAEFLSDKPLFADVAGEFLDFIGTGTKLVIHNASFDMKFLNAELKMCGRPALPWSRALDTLALAREKFPGAQNSLDALCRRFGIDNSARTLHGALLDSEILADVYLELIGGRQPDLVLAAPETRPATGNAGPLRAVSGGPARQRPVPLAGRLSEAEIAAHREFVQKIGEKAVWMRYMGDADG
ncbi:MAG TPA: DNA polymerase III subunit epsilon [Paracoccus sp. (in: a-proteobacteria)]|uniref:DNA polymerase III subunit epsilon n=1 Tax=uncultured Paracoccus sp. TaxID=189685 RepID=UPI0026330694|nr:DNA polymerase III subunit epsilon [uncultured Paracoccus sp.]HMQ40356.1 DNA polymerase III subunit epsilon [Paracoccus sp. (in: a-proteobacteria)]HMR36881.1 DNA polymerase III subunit epsilon [Paracoccus sp. (in: a-proteobacteria)]